MPTREPIASERRLRAHDKQTQVLELLKEGKTYEQIAEKVGYASKSGAHKAAMTALQQTLQVPADELRTLHRERLSLMWDAIFWAIKKGDPQAIDRGLKIMEREAKLMGIDAPTKIAPTTPDGTEEYAGAKEILASRLGDLLDAD